MKQYERFYIGGEWVDPKGSGHHEVVDACSEEVMGTVPAGNPEDVDRAVAAARGAFADWSAMPAEQRSEYLAKLAQGLVDRQQEMAELIVGEVGMPARMSRNIQAGLPAKVLGSYAALARELPIEEQVGNSLVVREPVGVVATVTPWNYPLHQLVAKVAAALAAGCTVVSKPSEVAPLNAFLFAEIVHDAGLPAGVFNLICGLGPVVGEAMAAHPDVDMISFTGSTRAGKRVSAVASETVKRVTLELGGKSANVILDDADLSRAVRTGVGNCFLNSGQTCSAWTRMLVPEQHYEEAVQIAGEVAQRFTVGDPKDPGTKLGPLVSAEQRDRVRSYIERGIQEGARVVVGGPEAPEGLDQGFFIQPTIFADVTPEMTIAREEIFGPVLVILPFKDDDDAVRLANDSIYGLAGAVWSGDEERAKSVARRMRTGQVDINGGAFNPLAPFGGYKQSGHGREFGKFGLEEYLETKSLQL